MNYGKFARGRSSYKKSVRGKKNIRHALTASLVNREQNAQFFGYPTRVGHLAFDVDEFVAIALDRHVASLSHARNPLLLHSKHRLVLGEEQSKVQCSSAVTRVFILLLSFRHRRISCSAVVIVN